MIVVMTMLYCHFTCFNWLGLKALKLVALSGGRLGGGVGCGWARFCQTRVKILVLTTCCFSFYCFLSFLIVCYMLSICLSIKTMKTALLVERLGGGRVGAVRHTLDF